MLELNKIYHRDCFDGMRDLPDSSVDMILCDLPYGCTDHEWDVKLPVKELWKEYRRISKKNSRIVLFGIQPFTAELITSNAIDFSHMLYWEKDTACGHLYSTHQPMRKIEEIAVFNNHLNSGEHGGLREYMKSEWAAAGVNDDVRYFIGNKGANHWFLDCSDFRIPTREYYEKLQKATGRFQRSYESVRQEFDAAKKQLIFNKVKTDGVTHNVLKYKIPGNSSRIHPTQKPVGLCSYLIDVYSNPGDLVLDNCIGSGTTAIAALESERHFIGFEIDPDYYKAASERLERAIAQGRLFGATKAG